MFQITFLREVRLPGEETESVEEVLDLVKPASSLWVRIRQGFEAKLGSLRLLERSGWARKILDASIRGIEVEPIPAYLGDGKCAIIVSNYPSVSQTLRAVLKVGCRLPGKELRLKAIARKEIVARANVLFKALGVDRQIFPALKDSSGKYALEHHTLKKILTHLDGQGNVLWLSITGKNEGNGLLERDLRTGAALFAVKKNIPIVPMGLVTEEKKGRVRIVRVRFGEPITPPGVGKLDEFERGDLLLDISRLMMCQIAVLLPPGQRGDFENIEDKLREAKSRLDQMR